MAAYEQPLEANEDGKLNRKYNRFLRDHERQARSLNTRLVELGGKPVEAGVAAGSLKAGSPRPSPPHPPTRWRSSSTTRPSATRATRRAWSRSATPTARTSPRA